MIKKTRKRSALSTAPKSSGQRINGLTLKTPAPRQPHEDSKEAEERYQRIFENSKDMFFATSFDGRHVDVNQTGVDLLGYGSKEEMMQVYARDVFLDSEDQKRFMDELAETGFVKDFETKLKRKDGTPINVLITAHTRRDDSDRILGYEGIVKDISDRKRMEEELVQRAGELQALYDLSMLINQNLDLDKVIPLALEQALSLTAFEMGSIHLLDEENGILHLKFQRGLSPNLAEKVKTFKVGEGVVGRAVQLKRPVFYPIDDFPDPDRLPILRESKVQALLGFPLLAKGKAIGGMVLLTRSYRVLPKNEINLLASIGNQIGLALENARLFSTVAKAKSEWETTFDAVTDLISIYGRDYRILRANKTLFEKLGLEPRQVIGKKCHEIHYSREVPCEGCKPSEVFKTGKPVSGERENKRLKGIYQSRSFPVFDQAGQVVCVVNFNREVTEEKRLALEKEVVNNTNKILASNPDVKQMIQAVHAELKKILDSERMTIALFDEERKGFHYLAQARDDELTDGLANHVHPLEGSLLERVVQTGLPLLVSDAAESGSWMEQKLVEEEGIRSSLIFPLEYKEKTIGTMNFSSKKVNHFSEGQFSLLRQVAPGLAISIQNALLFEETRQSEEKYRTVIETMQEGYFELDLAGTFTFANDMECENYGYTRNELIGMNYRKIVDEKTTQELYQTFNRLYHTGEPIKLLETERIRKDGTKAFSEISASLIRDSERKPIGFRGISRDVTERKRTEEVLKKSEAEARRLSQENAIMAEIGRIISSTLKVDDVYERLAEEVRKLIPSDRISISAINSRDQTFSVAYCAGTDLEGRLKGTVVPLAGTLTEEVFRTRTSMLVRTEDLKDLTDRFPKLSPGFQAGIRSLMAIPLISKDEVVGVLHIQSTRTDAYEEKDLRLAERVGHQIAGAIANAELFREWQQANEALRKSEETTRQLSRENAIMAEIGRIISSTLKVDDVYERFTEEVRKLIPFDRISISAINSRDQTISIPYCAGIDVEGWSAGIVVPFAGGISGELFRTRTKMLVRTEDLKDLTDRFPKLSPGFQAGIRSLMAIPLISKDEVVGVLQIQSTKPNAYDEENLRLAEKVGNQIAGAIANAELFKEWQQANEALRKSEETTRQLSQENAIIAEIGQIISSTLKVDDVYGRFAEKVHELIPFDRISIDTINFKDQTLTIAYHTGVDLRSRSKGSVVPLAGTLAAELFRTRTKMLVRTEDLKDLADRFPAFSAAGQAGMRSLMVIPLISKDEVVGVLHIQSTRADAYEEKDLRLTERVGNQISGAIANAELFREWQQADEALRKSEETTRQLSQENAIIAEIGQIISSTLKIDDVYERFAEEVRKLIPFERISIHTINSKDQTFSVPYNAGIDVEGWLKEDVIPLAGTFPGKVFRTRTKMLVRTEDLKDLTDRFPKFSPALRAGIRSLMAIPLTSKDEVIGVLQFLSTRADAYEDEDLQLAEKVGNQIAGAIANAELFREWQQANEALRKSEETTGQLSRENAIIAEIGQIISSTLNIEEVYGRFAEEVRSLIPFDRIVISTIDIENNTVSNIYTEGKPLTDRKAGEPLPIEGTGHAEMLRTKSTLLIQTEDFNEYKNQFPMLLSTFQAGFRSIMNVPLFSKGRIIGALLLRSLKSYAYADRDVRLAERVGHQIAGAIANAELFKELKQAEEALRDSEKRFRELFDAAPIGYFEVDTDACITRVNQTELEMLGYTAPEMIGRPIWDFLEEKEIAHQKLTAKLAGDLPTVKSFERTCIQKDGNRIPVVLEERLLKDREGRIIGLRSTMHNHTEYKRAEEALRRSEEAARRLAQENATMAEIGRIVSSTLNIHEVYERFAEETRKLISFDRIVIQSVNIKDNTTTLDYVSGTDVENRRSGDVISLEGTASGECVRTQSSCLFQGENPDELIKRFPGLLPTLKAGFRSILVVPLISKNQVIGVIHLRSFKPNAYTESDLRVAERVSNQIADAIASAQLFIARQQAEEALKRNQEELITKNKEIDEHRRNLQLALEELERAYKELKSTQSKILQQEKMASIGQLAAGVAHEINNPVAFISSNLGTLDKYVGRLTEFIQTQSQAIESLQMTDAVERLKQKQKELKLDYITEDVKGLIAESLDGAERVMKIVQGLKRFSRVDEADYNYADLNECIESTVNIVWNELKYKATLKKDYGTLPLTKCYPQQINQVFMNLLINAAQAIEKRGEITIKTWKEDQSIWAAISDTGSGIPKEHLNKIFEPFFTTKEVGKGTGLGLSITYEIVQKHNGEITVESEVGKGTTFTVRIPIL